MVGAIGFSSRTIPEEGAGLRHSSRMLELSIPIMALGFTSMMFGLVISSLVKTAEKTMPLLVMFAIIQVVFTGCLFTLHGSLGVNEFSYLMPSRWAVAAAGATLDFNKISPPDGRRRHGPAVGPHGRRLGPRHGRPDRPRRDLRLLRGPLPAPPRARGHAQVAPRPGPCTTAKGGTPQGCRPSRVYESEVRAGLSTRC